MFNLTLSIRLSLAVLLGGVAHAQTSPKPSGSDADDLYLSTKVLLETYAHDDTSSERARQASQTLRGKGPEAIPALIRLFHENRSDHGLRSAAVSTMFSISGGRAEVLRFVENELSKDPKEWYGGRWLARILGRLAEIDQTKARMASLRALELDDDILVRPSALGSLREFGKLEDIGAIESFITKHKREKPDALFDEFRAYARSAIAAIQARAEKEKILPSKW